MNLEFIYRSRNLMFWSLHLLGWSGYAIAQYLGAALYGKAPSYQAVIGVAAASGFLLSAPLRPLYQRLWLGGPKAMLLWAPLACWLMALLWRAIVNTSYMHFVDPGVMKSDNPLDIFYGTLSSTWLMLCWSGLYFGFKYYEGLQQEREATLRASTLARDAQLKMLRYQLNPHFLFNTLNAISTLVLDGHNRVANQALSRLSDFLRYTLDQDPMKKVTLRQELDALNLYLGIERLRFGERLRLEFEVDERAETALVPSLLLQPLVENALKYAVAPREAGGTIAVSAGLEGGRLRLVVRDDGPGLKADTTGRNGCGVGLRNTQDRLQVLYGERHQVRVDDTGSGLSVDIRIPLEA